MVLFNKTLIPGNFLAPNGLGTLAVAYDPAKGEIFAANFDSDSVSVVSDVTNAGVATIPVGVYPTGLVYDSGKGEVFVANSGSSNLSVISPATDTVVATVSTPLGANGVAYDSGKGEIFVNGPYSVTVVSDATNTVVATLRLTGNPTGMAYDGAKNEVFVSNGERDNVSVISDATNTVVTNIPVGQRPWGAAYDSGKGEVFVANVGSCNVSVISDANNTVVATITLPGGPANGYPYGVTYDSAKGEVFLLGSGYLNPSKGSVRVISDATNTVLAYIPVNVGPGGIYLQSGGLTYDSGKGEIFVAGAGSYTNHYGSLSAISATSDAVVAWIPLANLPDGVAYDPGKGEIFVTNGANENVSVVSDRTNTIVATVPVGGGTSGASYDGGKGEVFVSSPESTNVSVISDTTNSVTATIPVGYGASGLAYDSGKGEVFVADFIANEEEESNVSVISDSTNSVVASVPLGFQPVDAASLAYDSGKGEVFVADTYVWPGDPTPWIPNVTVISDSTNSVVQTIPVGHGLGNGYAVYDSARGEVVVATSVYDNLSVISDSTSTVVATVPVGPNCSGLAYVRDRGELVVTNSAENNLTVISDTGDATVGSVSAGGSPQAVAYDSGTGTLYVANPLQGTISILGWRAPVYPVTFTQSGLPNGSSWSVTLNGSTASSTTPAITFAEPSGIYSYSIGSPSGYASDPLSGVATVNGASFAVSVSFSTAYRATLTANSDNLPPGKTWSLTLGGIVVSATGDSSASVLVPNGTYPYLLRGPSGYRVSGIAPAGNLTVAGSVVTANGKPLPTFTFVRGRTVSGLFSRTTLPIGDTWCVTLEAWTSCTTQKSASLRDLSPGTYRYSLAPIPGFLLTATDGGHPVPLSGWVSLSSRNVAFHVKFAPVLYTATFRETGLKSTLTWHVKATCTTPKTGNVGCLGMTARRGSKSPTITMLLRNGTYAWAISPIKGYDLKVDGVVGWSGSLAVSGAKLLLNVTFVPDPPGGTRSASGLSSGAFLARET